MHIFEFIDMPIPSEQKSEKKHSVAREKIREATLEFLSENSVEALSMRAIAKVMGVSAMMPYHYYPTKADLLTDLRRILFEHFADYLQLCIEGQAPDPAQKLRLICHGYLRYASEAENDFHFIFETDTGSLDPEGVSGEKSWKTLMQAVGALHETVAIGTGDENSVVYKTHYVWCTLHGLATLNLSKTLGFGMNYKELSAKLVESIIAYTASASNEGAPDNPALPPVVALIKRKGKASPK